MLDKKALVAYAKPTSIAAEAYRVLRTNIQFSGVNRELKTVALTSPVPLEGKTTTVANLAVTLARAGNRVLLVDADLRKPRLHRIFGVSNYSGLTNVLANMVNIRPSCGRPLRETSGYWGRGLFPQILPNFFHPTA